MKTNTIYALVGLGIIFVASVSFYAGKNVSPSIESPLSATSTQEVATGTKATTTPPKTTTTAQKPATGGISVTGTQSTSGYLSYTNAEHGFSIKYPKYAKVSSSFATFRQIGNNWRVYASPANQGKGVVAVNIFNVDQGTYSTGNQSYPLYFMAEVRVGVSSNTKDCYEVDSANPNQKVTNVSINGVPFKKFSSSDSAMMKYVQVESYRTIRNNTCFAIEQMKSGTTYRDDKMQPGIADTQLDTYYATAGSVVSTFRFTK